MKRKSFNGSEDQIEDSARVGKGEVKEENEGKGSMNKSELGNQSSEDESFQEEAEKR
jgi:hypothetical protein